MTRVSVAEIGGLDSAGDARSCRVPTRTRCRWSAYALSHFSKNLSHSFLSIKASLPEKPCHFHDKSLPERRLLRIVCTVQNRCKRNCLAFTRGCDAPHAFTRSMPTRRASADSKQSCAVNISDRRSLQRCQLLYTGVGRRVSFPQDTYIKTQNSETDTYLSAERRKLLLPASLPRKTP